MFKTRHHPRENRFTPKQQPGGDENEIILKINMFQQVLKYQLVTITFNKQMWPSAHICLLYCVSSAWTLNLEDVGIRLSIYGTACPLCNDVKNSEAGLARVSCPSSWSTCQDPNLEVEHRLLHAKSFLMLSPDAGLFSLIRRALDETLGGRMIGERNGF